MIIGVTTFLTEGGFEELHEPPMPGEEKPGEMDQLGVEDMRCFEVIVSRTSTGGFGGIDPGRQSMQTFDGLDVLQTGWIIQVAPAIQMSLSNISIVARKGELR